MVRYRIGNNPQRGSSKDIPGANRGGGTASAFLDVRQAFCVYKKLQKSMLIMIVQYSLGKGILTVEV